jgi:hypothetical protein
MKSIIRTLILPSLLLFSCASPSNNSRIDLSATAKAPAGDIPVVPVADGTIPPAKKNVQLSILLDTSNSMDGLINQAKSQLWNIVNELAESQYEGETPNLYIAVYEYGNDGLPMTSGYIRQVTEFTADMDIVSRDLFSLTTNGGSEYCGHVINTSLDELQWTEGDSDLKIIYIAGNEEFTQGMISFRESCKKANERDIVVNTIYCGELQEGIRTSWKEGADLTGGEYFAINSDAVTVQVASPYDQRIGELNYALNDTYIYYGDQGLSGYANCTTQDDNAKGSGSSSFNGRNKFKASGNYRNTSWNLIDLEGDALTDTLRFIDNSTLPGEYQTMGADELLKTVQLKQEEKEKIQTEMSDLIQKREAFVKEQLETSGEDNELEDAMLKSIRKQAEKKKLSFDKGC